MRSVEIIPADVWRFIFLKYLDIQEVLNTVESSKYFLKISLDQNLWKALVQRDYLEIPRQEDWKKAYISLYQAQKALNLELKASEIKHVIEKEEAEIKEHSQAAAAIGAETVPIRCDAPTCVFALLTSAACAVGGGFATKAACASFTIGCLIGGLSGPAINSVGFQVGRKVYRSRQSRLFQEEAQRLRMDEGVQKVEQYRSYQLSDKSL